MDYKKIKTTNTTITRDLNDFDVQTGNIYESVVIMSKRADQISNDLKEELDEKVHDFSAHDNSEDGVENKEQIELVRYYEQMPKPTLLAEQEFLDGQVYFRTPEKKKK
ncbi:MAG: DNA-directed RNA polymerase subunit omega [Bacteroidales bacterium]|nr:DNA-directed RNA polymerase subunit omega [Bacteroidales bacterium]